MFRALLCSSSGVKNCIIQHLASSHSVVGTGAPDGHLQSEEYNKLIIKQEFVHQVDQLVKLYKIRVHKTV